MYRLCSTLQKNTTYGSSDFSDDSMRGSVALSTDSQNENVRRNCRKEMREILSVPSRCETPRFETS